MKKLPKKLVWTLGVILGLILILALALRLFFPAEKIREMAVNLASEKLGREVTVQDAGVSLSGGLGVSLAGVVVANPGGFTGAPFFAAENIDLKLALGPLLHKEFQVRRLVVDRPRVSLVRQPGNVNNFTFEAPDKGAQNGGPSGQAPAGGDEELAVRFDRMEIHEGHLSYRDEETGQGVDLTNLGWTGNLSQPDPGKFHSRGLVTVDSLIVTGEVPLPALAMLLDYELTYDTALRELDLSHGEGEVGDLPVELTGRMSVIPDSLRASGIVKAANLQLTELLAYLPPEQQAKLEDFTVAGAADVTAEIEFDQTRPEPLGYSGTALVKNLRARSGEVEGELTVGKIQVEFEADKLRMKSEGGSFANQPLELELTVRDFEDAYFAGRLAGEIDLAFVGPFLPPEKDISMAGRCALNSTFEGRASDIDNLKYAGKATFKGVSYADNVLPDTLLSLNGTASFNPEAITVEKMDAVFGAGDLSVAGRMVNHLPYFLPAEKDNRASLPKPEITFTATSRRIDIDRLFPAAAPGATVQGSPGSSVLPDSLVSQAMPDVLATGTIQADTLIYSRVPFTSVFGEIDLADRILTCRNMSARVYGGTAAGNVAIDLNDLNDPAYNGEFNAQEIEADNFVSRFVGRSGVLFGKTGMAGSFQARGRDPERIRKTLTLDSEAALVSGKVVTGEFVGSTLGSLAAKAGQSFDKEQGLKDLTTMIKVENGRVGLNDLTTRLGKLGDLTLGGSYGFDGGLEYSGSILLTKEQTASLYSTGGLVGSVANLFGNRAERIRLPLSVGGTMTSPKLDIDYSELTENLRSQVNEGLKDELDSKLKGLFGK